MNKTERWWVPTACPKDLPVSRKEISDNETMILMNCAKGHWQKYLISEMLNHGKIFSPLGQDGKIVKACHGSYWRSMAALCKRVEEKTPFCIVRVPGVRGGEWTAYYYLTRK